jgi:hypothetical protein
MDKLRANGSVRVAVDELGHRSAFVGAVLTTLPRTRVTTSPATVTLTNAEELEARDPDFAVLDSTAGVKIRKEQLAQDASTRAARKTPAAPKNLSSGPCPADRRRSPILGDSEGESAAGLACADCPVRCLGRCGA